MHEFCKYQIEVQDGVDRIGIGSASPFQLKIIRANGITTLLEIFTDQAGLIGVLRFLHQQGYVLLSIQRSSDKTDLQEMPTDE